MEECINKDAKEKEKKIDRDNLCILRYVVTHEY